MYCFFHFELRPIITFDLKRASIFRLLIVAICLNFNRYSAHSPCMLVLRNTPEDTALGAQNRFEIIMLVFDLIGK